MLKLPKATISRLTYTLCCLGYLTSTEYYGKYQLGASTLSLGYPLLAQFSIRRSARPLMHELALSLDCSVSIGIRDRYSMVYIEVVRANGNNIYPHDVGSTHSLLGTALGRAYLLGCTPASRAAILNQVQIKSPRQWVEHGNAVLENIRDYPQFGCCTALGDIIPDVQAVAVPLGEVHGIDVAALSCTFQGRTLNINWLRNDIAPQLRSIARAIT